MVKAPRVRSKAVITVLYRIKHLWDALKGLSTRERKALIKVLEYSTFWIAYAMDEAEEPPRPLGGECELAFTDLTEGIRTALYSDQTSLGILSLTDIEQKFGGE